LTNPNLLQDALFMCFKHHTHGRLPDDVKEACVIACSKAYEQGVANYGFAVQALKRLGSGKWYAIIGGCPSEMLHGVWGNFCLHHILKNAPRPCRPPVFSKQDAVETAALLKKGKVGSFIQGARHGSIWFITPPMNRVAMRTHGWRPPV
jgi:hypothetical protein